MKHKYFCRLVAHCCQFQPSHGNHRKDNVLYHLIGCFMKIQYGPKLKVKFISLVK